MKTISKSITFLLLAACVLCLTAAAKPKNDKPAKAQLEAQIALFDEAINAMGACTPEQAVSLWIKGEQTRNGVYKYAVACKQLKQELIANWGKPEQSIWVIGTSSPWVTGSEIVSKEVVSDKEINFRVQYFWATSTGPAEPTSEDIVVNMKDCLWCVKSATPAGK